jgi:HD-GYP domain-containing protein (c-di-GMP phosphodiesterase class II)
MRRLSIPILAQITIPYVVVAVLLALLGTFLVTRGVFDTVEERFTNQLLEAGLRADENVVREENNLLETLRLVSNVGSLDAAITTNQPATVETLVLPIAYNSNLECFAILNMGGEALVSQRFNSETQLYEDMQTSLPLNQLAYVSAVLAGQVDALGDKFAGFAATERGNMLLLAGPVKDGVGNQVGVAIVGVSAENLAEIIRLQTLAHTSFYGLDGVPLVSTLDSAPNIEPEIAAQVLLRQQEGSYQREIQDTGITYRELLVNLELREGQDIGIMGVAIPTNFISQSSQINRPTTYLMIAVGLGLALLFGFVIAGRITRPIRDLKTAAQRVASGDLRVKIERPGSDEVGLLSQSFNTMVDSLNRSQRALLDTYNKTIEGWARAMDLRDHETEGHSRRVADLSVALASELGYSGQALAHIRRGALLHDIGKIAIPDSVLLKEGKLTEEERKLMRQHPIYAQSFIGEIDFLKPAMDIPVNHHEKWDGTGYPRGLRGEEIPFAARIFAVVDVWDALTSDRPYRKAESPKEVMIYLESESARHFDPAVVKAFKKLMKL